MSRAYFRLVYLPAFIGTAVACLLAYALTLVPAHAEDRKSGYYLTAGAGWTDYGDPDAGLTAKEFPAAVTHTDDSWAAMIGAGYQFAETPLAIELRGTYARHYAPDGVPWLPYFKSGAIPVTRLQACGFWTPDIGLTIHPYAGPCIGAGYRGIDPDDRDAVKVSPDERAVNIADVGLAVDLIAGARFDITRDGSLQIGPEFGIGWLPLSNLKGVDHEDESAEYRVLAVLTWRM